MRISTGSNELDKLLEGGYEKGIINTLYGPAGSGKTLLCMLVLLGAKKKAIYVDTEGGFSVERLKQLTPDYEKILDRVVFLKPTNFEEQKRVFEKLKELVNDRIDIIIVDTISMLYRLELGKNDDVHETNRELGLQLGWLNEIARKKDIPILIANQVYANFEERDKVNIVGGDLLKYGSKCMLELQITPNELRRCVLRKHRSIAAEKSFDFRIVNKGIEEAKRGRWFIPL